MYYTLVISWLSLCSKTTVSKTVEGSANLSVLTSTEMHKNYYLSLCIPIGGQVPPYI